MTTKTSKRVAKQLNPPNLEENPAERKRQLNVLAQRRYRQRKREHLQKLEQTAASKRLNTTGYELAGSTPASTTDIIIHGSSTQDYTPEDFSTLQTATFDWPDIGDPIEIDHNGNDICSFDPSSTNDYGMTFDLRLPPLSTSPTLSSSASPQSPASSSTYSDKQTMSRDELHLPMLQLTLFRGMLSNAKRLELDDLIFDLHAKSPFCLPNDTAFSKYSQLPPNLRPTAMQLSIPHHPALDLIPWPDVRDKLILVFSQPAEFRPPSARSPTAFVEFVHDFEDPTDGARIWGDDPAEEKNWEVGEKVYNKWWWALTGKVVVQANIWRKMRGARLLGDSAS